MAEKLHCIRIGHFLKPFLCWWTSRLVPYNKHWCEVSLWCVDVEFFGYIPTSGRAVSNSRSTSSFLMSLLGLPSGWSVLWGSLSISLPAFVISFLNKGCDGYSWLLTWRHLEWPTIQKWRAQHLWSIGTWGIVAMKSLGPGKVVQAFNPKRLRQGDPWVQGQPGTKKVKDLGVVIHTFNLGQTFYWKPT